MSKNNTLKMDIIQTKIINFNHNLILLIKSNQFLLMEEEEEITLLSLSIRMK
jgi:hypothetical protein